MRFIDIPTLNWFQANPWDKIGNVYTGSVGADSIKNNAFLFKITFYRKDDGDEFVADVYDSFAQLDPSLERVSNTFPATQDGRVDMIEWLDFQYKDFCDSGRNKLQVEYNKK